MRFNKNYVWVTPSGKNKIPLFRLGEWIEVYPSECLLIHVSNLSELVNSYGFKVCRPKVYRTKKAARKAGLHFRFTE